MGVGYISILTVPYIEKGDHRIPVVNWNLLRDPTHIAGFNSYILLPYFYLLGGDLCCLSLFCLVTPDQAADDLVKIRVTKYKTGSSSDGEVKVQEMGEGDPQWQHIKDVVKEQLEKAGLKAEGRKGSAQKHTARLSFPPDIFSVWSCHSSLLIWAI